MKWLFWKDFRHNLPIVIFGLILLLLPHLFALWGMYLQANSGSKLPWQDNFVMSSLWAFILSQLTVAVASGNAIAGERADRSAEFLGSLPIARRKILASKLLFALAIIAAIWVTTGLMVWGLVRTDPTVIHLFARSAGEMLCAFAAVAISGAAIFGPAWFLSSLAASPTIAVCAGLATPLTVWLGVLFVHSLFGPDKIDVGLGLWYAGVCLTLGIAGFVAGTWYYLRRVEP
jgi:ABC-type transport system involved in multi-copper enzyme maturation permease subunit